MCILFDYEGMGRQMPDADAAAAPGFHMAARPPGPI
jgi:hypothetical protein